MSDQIYRFAVGNIECIAFQEGEAVIPAAEVLIPSPGEDLGAALAARGYSAHEITMSYNCLYLRGGGHQVLVDAGLGPEDAGPVVRHEVEGEHHEAEVVGPERERRPQSLEGRRTLQLGREELAGE